MANRTVKDATSVHGTNPQYLVEKIIRTRIYDSKYWKEECFALTAELLVDKAMSLRYIGGVHGGNIKPSPFLCLTLKMLQIQPEKDIVIEFIKQDEFKYLRALGSFYLRLVYPSLDCYKYLEPLLNDYRKLRLMDRNGIFYLSYMDQFIDNLLREERFCDVILPRIQKRWVHEANNELDPRVSLLEDDLDDLDSESEEDEAMPASPLLATSPKVRSDRTSRRSPPRDKRRRSPSPADHHKRRRDKERRHAREPGRDRDRGASDYYGSGNYPSDGYHDYHHGNQDYHNHHHYGGGPEYHSRRAHHGGAHGGDHHHRDSHRGADDHHRHESHHSRGGDNKRRRDDKRDKREGRKKEGRGDKKRSGGDGGLQAEIDEANALRAQLGLPPLK